VNGLWFMVYGVWSGKTIYYKPYTIYQPKTGQFPYQNRSGRQGSD